MKMRDEYTCPLELTHDAIKGKWKFVAHVILDDQHRTDSSLLGAHHRP